MTASWIGATLGAYVIVDVAGVGGMATVYRARQVSLDREVAVKVLPNHLALDPTWVQRFLNEVRAVSHLEHPHILPVYDHGEQNQTLYLVMRYVATGTLKDRLGRQPLNPAEVVRLITQIGNALDYAHTNGVIHRDLKPSNILLDGQGHAYLADFGLARTLNLSQQFTTSGTGVVVGTPAYMSPEQGQGLPVGARSDLYALGVILYELLTGRTPFAADTPVALVLKHIQEPLPDPRLSELGLPSALGPVLIQATAKDPATRYASGQEFADAVTAAFNTITGSTRLRPTPRPPAPPELLQTPVHQLPPFVAGPPILHPVRFFGRDRELRRLFNLIRRMPLQNAAIVGPPRSGKTSLLHYLRTITLARPEQLRSGQRQDWLPDPQTYTWIFVDFQDPRLGQPASLLQFILQRLDLPSSGSPSFDQFLDLVSQHLRRPTIVLFDEIGVALERYPQLDNAFWEGLRSLAANQVNGQLAYILTAHQPLEDLARRSGLGSPFFNIFGYTATLGPLTETETLSLIASSPITFPVEDVEWIAAHSGGWPVLVQILCRERLLALEEGELDDHWRTDGLAQLEPFRRALLGTSSS